MADGPKRKPGHHHGDLRRVLIEATIALIETEGPEQVSVRNAARLAGVSPGAPFRHFPTRAALMTAVAEEAMRRFRTEIETELTGVTSKDPLDHLLAIGRAYLTWVIRNPTHFRVISTRQWIDFDGSPVLTALNAEIVGMMRQQLAAARDQDGLRDPDIARVALSCRAMVYGLARMYVDGHFPQWAVAPHEIEREMRIALERFLDGLRPRS